MSQQSSILSGLLLSRSSSNTGFKFLKGQGDSKDVYSQKAESPFEQDYLAFTKLETVSKSPQLQEDKKALKKHYNTILHSNKKKLQKIKNLQAKISDLTSEEDFQLKQKTLSPSSRQTFVIPKQNMTIGDLEQIKKELELEIEKTEENTFQEEHLSEQLSRMKAKEKVNFVSVT